MANYLPPSAITPIYNPSFFPTLTSDLTVSTADLRYVSLSANQNVNGLKTFTSSAKISNGQSLILTPISFPAKTSQLVADDVNQDLLFSLPSFPFDASDVLTSVSATHTLFNKTMNTLKVGASGTTYNMFQSGTVDLTWTGVGNLQQVSTAITFSPAFTTQPRVFLTTQTKTAGGASTATVADVGSVSQNGFTAIGINFNGGALSATLTYAWFAIG